MHTGFGDDHAGEGMADQNGRAVFAIGRDAMGQVSRTVSADATVWVAGAKKHAWDDMKLLMRQLGTPVD